MHLVPGLRLRVRESIETAGIDESEMGEYAYDYVSLETEPKPPGSRLPIITSSRYQVEHEMSHMDMMTASGTGHYNPSGVDDVDLYSGIHSMASQGYPSEYATSVTTSPPPAVTHRYGSDRKVRGLDHMLSHKS